MSKQDHALYRDVLAARAQEPFKQSRRLVELHARRASAPVAERAPLHEVAVAVVLAEPPGITDAVHGGVEMFPLDGDQPLRAQQKMSISPRLLRYPRSNV